MNSDSGGNLSTYVLSGLAIFGIALGGFSLYVGLRGQDTETRLNDRISELEQRTDRLAGADVELQAQFRSLNASSQSTMEGVANAMAALREELKTQPPPAAATPASVVEDAASDGRTYTIRPGDLLGKVAHNHDTTVDAILKVNPGLDPKRLKIGQVINLP